MNTWHIFKKEMLNYFSSPIAYVFFGFFILISSFFFTLSFFNYADLCMLATGNTNLMRQMNPANTILAALFGLMGFLLIFLVPVITMRLFSEEKKLGTIELLFTYPITETQMVLGKFLAAAAVIVIMFAFSVVYLLIYRRYFSPMPWGIIGSGYLGMLLVAFSFLSFGMWVSSLTSDQSTSALATVGGLILLWVLGSAKMTLKDLPIGDVLEQLSLSSHFQNLVKGIIDTHDVLFFLLFIFLFIFLTIQVLEVRKWKG